ncbi:MAG: transposase [Hyphomicrobiaceae bacterium]
MSDRFDHTLERKLESKADEADDAGGAVRRLELITGTGRRRRWSSDEKARILVESLKPGANISEVARRNGLSPQQLFGWRREVRDPERAPSPVRKRGRPKKDCGGALGVDKAPAHFAPVVIAAPAAPPSPPTGASPGTIEITIGDAVVRVSGQVDISLLAAVLRAVRRAS